MFYLPKTFLIIILILNKSNDHKPPVISLFALHDQIFADEFGLRETYEMSDTQKYPTTSN